MRAVAKSVKCKGIKSSACNFDNSAALIGVGDRRAHHAALRAEPPSKRRRIGEPLISAFLFPAGTQTLFNWVPAFCIYKIPERKRSG